MLYIHLNEKFFEDNYSVFVECWLNPTLVCKRVRSIFILFAETTLDKNKGGYPLFGNVALTTCFIISKWTFTASVFLTTKMVFSLLIQVSFFAQ